MAESFGDEFTIVEVASDDPEPKKELWLALAKPDQALTLVLTAVPEGWTFAECACDNGPSRQLAKIPNLVCIGTK